MKPGKKTLGILTVIVILAVYTACFGLGKDIKGAGDMRFGIDIRGGVEAVFEPVGLDRNPAPNEIEAARNIIETRLDDKNITDREVTTDNEKGYVIVRFPWKSDEKDFKPEAAIAELGDMANLTFRDENGTVMLEGRDVSTSRPVEYSDQTGMKKYEVELQFTKEGADKFADATGKLVGRRMGIYMDEELISNPVVQDKITGGNAVINGMETYAAAKNLSDKINAGALPYAMETKNFSTISPSLGSNALNIMIFSGVLAFICICIFMIAMYRLPGLVACFGLVLQTSIQLLAISIPQYTLTLPGIAGIILTIGMAVDGKNMENQHYHQRTDWRGTGQRCFTDRSGQTGIQEGIFLRTGWKLNERHCSGDSDVLRFRHDAELRIHASGGADHQSGCRRLVLQNGASFHNPGRKVPRFKVV